MKKKIIFWVKKKIIIWVLVIVLSLSGVATAALLLINNARNADIDVAQGNGIGATETGGLQIEPGDASTGDQDTNPGDEEQDGDSDDDTPYEYLTIRFVTNGGDAVSSKKVIKGRTLSSVPVTQKEDAFFDGWYTDAALTEQFYQSEPITADMTLYAKYDDLEKQQDLLNEKYTLTDQQPDLAFNLDGEQNLTTAQVLDGITLEIADGSKYVALTATGSNPYTVRADGGFTPGATYILTLGEGLTFDGKPESCRECSFTIHKDEVMNLHVSDSLTYIPANDDVSAIIVNGESVDRLVSGLTGNEDSIAGTFTYSGSETLANGSVICLYYGTHPNDRTLGGDYTGQDIAYLRITGVSGDTISFESITEEDAGEVLFMPNTFPLDIVDFPGEFLEGDTDFDLVFDPADFSEFADMGIDADTTVDPGDFIVLYDGSDPDFAKYLEITVVAQNGGGSLHITFKVITMDEMTQAMEYYIESSQSGEEMLRNVNVDQLETQIETQVIESGFAQKSMEYLAAVSAQTDGFKEISGLQDVILTNENGQPLSSDEIGLWSLDFPLKSDLDGDGVDDITVDVEISDEPTNFSKGVRVALTINADYSVELDSGDEINIIIEDATFVQEVSIGFGASGGAVWAYYDLCGIPIPYIKDYQMIAAVDVFDFTGIEFTVKIQTHEADTGLNYTDITEQLKGLLHITDPDELDAGVQDLFEKYCEMLKTETDYVEIFNQSVFDKSGWVDPLFIIAYNVQINFKIYADINIMLYENMQYSSGTRYIFWFMIEDEKAGSSTVDLMDETFSFEFYIMGKLGLKVGLEFKFAVGLFSTDLGSIGLSAEAGPYLELYGYFVYTYTKVKTANTPDWATDEKIKGALYIEFGIYLEVNFNAEALAGEYAYSYTLYEDEWELLTAGAQDHVYDFANSGEEKEVVIRDVKTIPLPAFCRNMNVLDLKEGTLYQAVYGPDKYKYRLSNPNFAIDSSGNITVTVPSGVQYMECDLTLTWKVQKLAFTNKDLTSTVHLVWTNLTNKELEEKFEVSVKVGSIDTGYTTVWSRLVVKNSEFELPSVDAIKALMGYDDNTAVIGGTTKNLKYEDCIGYSVDLKQKVFTNTVYYFDVVEREYEITIDGIQDADGSTRSEKFTALYNEAFNLCDLEDTGTSDSGTYTKYVRTNCSKEDGKQATDVINRAFAIQLLEKEAAFAAEYADNSCTVTYHFVADPDPDIDLVIADVVVTVEKGGTPEYAYWTYLAGQSTSYIAYGWDTPPGRVTGDTTFTAYCKVAEGQMHTITLEENGGTEVADLPFYKGVLVPTPGETTKDGYDFGGWYEDEALLTTYTFGEAMPEVDFTLYAKWTAGEYTVMFDPGIGNSVDPASKVVTFGETYGSLPTAVHADTAYRFTGWYTEGDTEVTSTNTVPFMESGGITLYAHYADKDVIDVNYLYIDVEPQVVYYNRGTQNFTLNFTIEDRPTDNFQIQYKLYGVSGAEYVNSVSDVGVYTVQVKRPACGTYKYYEQTIDAAFEIKKAPRTFPVPAPEVTDMTTFSITVVPIEVQDDYGVMMYAINDTNVRPTNPDAWTTSCTIPIPYEGYWTSDHYVFAKLLGGEFYEDAYSISGTYVRLPFTGLYRKDIRIECRITVGEVDWQGVEGIISGSITSSLGEIDFVSVEGSFTEGSVITLEAEPPYDFGTVRVPWDITGVKLQLDNSLYSYMEVESVEILVEGVVIPMLSTIDYPEDMRIYNWYTIYDDTLFLADFRRVITDVGSFGTWGDEYVMVNDKQPGPDLHLTYDGEAVDQYTEFSDISYGEIGAPHIEIELVDQSNEMIYGDCFWYSDTDFFVDKDELLRAMLVTGDTSITFTATLIFPTDYITEDTAVWTQTITITVEEIMVGG